MTTIGTTTIFFSNDDPTLATSSVEIDKPNSQIILGKNLTTTPEYIIISPSSISDGTNSTSFPQLTALSQALASVELPPNATTLQLNKCLLLTDGTNTMELCANSGSNTINSSNQIDFNNTISLVNNNIKDVNNIDLNTINGMSPTAIGLTWADFDPNNAWSHLPFNQYGLNTYAGNSSFWAVNQFSMNDTTGGYSTYQNPSNFQIVNVNNGFNGYLTLIGGAGSNTIGLDCGGGNNVMIGDCNDANNKTKIIINDTHKEIDLNCVDLFVNKQGSANMVLTPTFTNLLGGGISFGGGSWQIVASNTMNIPNDLLAETNGMFDWKMEFFINCWNMSNQTDKATALYIEIVDNASNTSVGYSFNLNNPYTTHKNNSTYSNTNNSVENYGWIDYYNFNNFTSSPLTINLWWYNDNGLSCDFRWNLHLSKTNVV